MKCKPLLAKRLTEKAEERGRKMVTGNGSEFWLQNNVFYIWQRSCADEISPMWLHKHYLQIDNTNRHVITDKKKFTRSHSLIKNRQEYMAAEGRRRRIFWGICSLIGYPIPSGNPKHMYIWVLINGYIKVLFCVNGGGGCEWKWVGGCANIK